MERKRGKGKVGNKVEGMEEGREGESYTAGLRFMAVLIALIPYTLIIQTPSLAGGAVTGAARERGSGGGTGREMDEGLEGIKIEGMEGRGEKKKEKQLANRKCLNKRIFCFFVLFFHFVKFKL